MKESVNISSSVFRIIALLFISFSVAQAVDVPPITILPPAAPLSVGETLTLDGDHSFSPVGDPLTFQWFLGSDLNPVSTQSDLTILWSDLPSDLTDVSKFTVTLTVTSHPTDGDDLSSSASDLVDVVPEPSSWLLMLSAIGLIGLWRRQLPSRE